MIAWKARAAAGSVAGSSNWWEVAGKTCVAAYQAVGAASYADSLVDLSGSGNDATEGVAPSWDALTGWTFNGSAYLNTPVVASATNLVSVAMRYSDTSSPSGAAIGRTGSDRNLRVYVNFSSQTFHSYSSGQDNSKFSGALSAAVIVMTPNAVYQDGAERATFVGSLPANSNTISIARDGGASNFNGNIQAISVYSDTLTADEVATVTAAMQAL